MTLRSQTTGRFTMGRVLIATAVTGFVLNLAGWVGNVFLLSSIWEQAHKIAPPPMPSPFPSAVHVVLQFLSDFVFAFVLCCVYRVAAAGWRGSTLALAFLCSVLVWLGGVPMTYLGLVNGGYLPAGVSIATSVLALVGFLIVAPLLPPLLRDSHH